MPTSYFDPLHFLNLAKEMPSAFPMYQEAALRTAIGRFYYATFLIIRERLAIQDPDFRKRIQEPGTMVHEEVRRALKVRGLFGASSMLLQLRKERNQSDYELGKKVEARDFERARSLAEHILRQVEDRL